MTLSGLTTPYDHCPLCNSTDFEAGLEANIEAHTLYHENLPDTINWMQCRGCGHIFTQNYWSQEGLTEVFRHSNSNQIASPESVTNDRIIWSEVVNRIMTYLPAPARTFSGDSVWLDVGCGSGGLVRTAQEFGFNAIGLDLRQDAVDAITAQGYRAVQGDLYDIELDNPATLISFADVLEHMANPVEALLAAHRLLADEGIIFVSCPNTECATWRQMDASGNNPYWQELEHHHNFSRTLMMQVLKGAGFQPIDYNISKRYLAAMEIIAVKSH